MRRILHAILIALGLLSAGCGSHPAYSVSIQEPHKDVLLVEVEVNRPLSVPEYRSIAERELPSVLTGARQYRSPLYEVRFEYLAPIGDGTAMAERVATYVWRRESPGVVGATFKEKEQESP